MVLVNGPKNANNVVNGTDGSRDILTWSIEELEEIVERIGDAIGVDTGAIDGAIDTNGGELAIFQQLFNALGGFRARFKSS